MKKGELIQVAQQNNDGPKLPVVNVDGKRELFFGTKPPMDKDGGEVLPVVYDDQGKPRYCFTALAA